MAGQPEASSPRELEDGYRKIRGSFLFAGGISAPFLAGLVLYFYSVPVILVALGLIAYWIAAVLGLRMVRRGTDRRIREIQAERAGLAEPPRTTT